MLFQKYKLKNPIVEAAKFDGTKKMSDALSLSYYDSIQQTASLKHDGKHYLVRKNDYVIFESDVNVIIMNENDFNLSYEKDDTQ